jgi:ubiquinone/menaquinone biosynthesis C-methylase UbiE
MQVPLTKRPRSVSRAKWTNPFFVPGQTSPFAPWDPHFSLYLIKLFGVSAPLLNLQRGEMVIDSGCGYAWTTEWLFRSGFNPIGVDICRTYLEIAVDRMGTARPHLVVADVENLPFNPETAKAVLAYESFHHIPDRRRAMSQYERVLQDGGVVVLAEPGAAHEEAQVAVDAMKKYGILEKGMELADVKAYADGTTFSVEQLFLARVGDAELGAWLEPDFVRTHSVVEGNLFRLVKGRRQREPSSVPNQARPQQRLLSRLKARLKAAIEPRGSSV